MSKSTHCSPGFDSQRPHDWWLTKSSLTPDPGSSVPSPDLCRHQAHTWWTKIHTGKTLILIKLKLKQIMKYLFEAQ